uniref:Uncharacterized protein n=1 Tax=Opuntia streptacantha TaxID=393608 RepID=A0A7C8YL43_OPUST
MNPTEARRLKSPNNKHNNNQVNQIYAKEFIPHTSVNIIDFGCIDPISFSASITPPPQKKTANLSTAMGFIELLPQSKQLNHYDLSLKDTTAEDMYEHYHK